MTESIEWKKKALMVPGEKARVIPLNEQAYDALARWSKERVNCDTDALFITNKGKLTGLSDRSLDNLIRTTARRAGISRRVNARILRSTFAVRLLEGNISDDAAAQLLGITSPVALERYKGAKQAQTESTDLSHLDSRTPVTKLVSKLSSPEPKTPKVLDSLNGVLEVHPSEQIFGRTGVIRELKSALTNTQSTLIEGDLGVGKTHLIRHMQVHFKHSIYVSSPTPVKRMLRTICEFLDTDWQSAVGSRPSNQDLLDFILANGSRDQLIIIDDLHKLRASNLDLVLELLKEFTVLTATLPKKLKHPQLQFKFKRIELKPLPEAGAKELIQYLTQNIPVADYEMMETRVMNLSNGYPLAIVDMVNQLRYERVVDAKAVRDVYHEAGVRYRDWTYGLMIFWAGLTAMRYVAMGRHSFEAHLLAGLGGAGFMIFRFFIFKMR